MKIQAKDLRIGNHVMYENNVYKLSAANILDLTRNEGKEFEGIPITKDWLIKLGFIKDVDTSFRWFLLDELIAYDLDDHAVRILGGWEFGKRKYVHELQNLIYVLTMSDAKL